VAGGTSSFTLRSVKTLSVPQADLG